MKSLLFKILTIFGLFLFFQPTLFAIQLANDTFSNKSADGYSRDDGWNNQLKIKGKEKSSKTYNFGSAYASTQVSISFKMKWKGSWDKNQDYFKGFINNSQVINDTFSGESSDWTTYSGTVTTDINGKLKVEFYADTTSSSEYVVVDDVKIVVNSVSTCSPLRDSADLTLSNPSYDTSAHYNDSHWNVGPNETSTNLGSNEKSRAYHFTIDHATTVYISLSGVDNEQARFSVSKSTCPTTKDNLKNTQLDFSAAGDFYVYVYYVPGNHTSIEHILNVSTLEPIPPEGDRDFTLYRQDNIVGDIQLIGNSVKLDSTKGGQCAPNGVNNNSITTTYADEDNNNTTYNSTSANLVLPANVTSNNILYATLYWQGRVIDKRYVTRGRTVKIKTYGQTSYQTISSISSKFNRSAAGRDYQGIADITQIIKDSIDARASATGYNEPIWVADVYAPRNDNGFGVWSLAVVYEDSTSVLKNISTYDGYKHVYNNTITTTLNNFLTPKKGVVNSNFYVFAGEGDITLKDSVTLTDKNNQAQSLGSNIFKSSIDIDGVNVTNRNPSCQNTIGTDIRGFSVGTNGNIPIIGNGQTSTTIKLTSNGDEYIPGLFVFATQLYEPRVCYYIDTIVDSNNHNIFENAAFTSDINANENYKFNIWISNMKKNTTDIDLEDADLVQVYMKTTDFTYKDGSTKMTNIGASLATVSDPIDGDLGEYDGTDKHTWRVGLGATYDKGGKLEVANTFSDNSKKAFISFEGKLNIQNNATTINLLNYLNFKASFQTDSITIGPENAQKIAQCQNLDVSGGVGAPAGAYNAVDAGTTVIKTKISGRAFPIQILSYKTGTTIPQASSKDLTIDIIPTPNWTGILTTDAGLCSASSPAAIYTLPSTINLGGANNKIITIPAITKAYKNVTIRITDDSSVSCSSDPFAIRPEKFILKKPAGQVLTTLTSGRDFFFPITATLDGVTTAAMGYTITNALANFPTLDADKVTYLSTGAPGTLNGTLVISPMNFSFTNGVSTGMPVSFDDVGQVEINLKDKIWAKIDASDGTPQDCTTNGAYICGKITPTYIPDHFTFVTPTIRNNNGTSNAGDFTYIANSIPANPIPFTMAGRIDTKIEARNSKEGITTNFDQAPTMYENPIDMSVVIAGTPLAANVTSIAAATLAGAPLGFANGKYTVAWNSTDVNRMLRFNFPRQVNTVENPFQVLPANVTLTASSIYGATTVRQDVLSGSSISIGQSATFVYGRTHAPRQTFIGNMGTELIYFEVYCGSIPGSICDKTLLPNGTASTITDDPRWFVNANHTQLNGSVGAISGKFSAEVSVAGAITGASVINIPLTYDGTRGYPYKTTMLNTPSTWLIYDQYNVANNKNTNEFEVKFINPNTNWAGKHETDTTTKNSASDKTNRRSMW